MGLKKYVIKKGNTSLLSSLKALNENVLKECMEDYGADDIKELKNAILDDFEATLEACSDDVFTKRYFENLLEFENSERMFAYEDDVKSFIVFVYRNDNHYSYYIPNEIKKIINDILFKQDSLSNETSLFDDFDVINCEGGEIKKDLNELLNLKNKDELKNIGKLLLLDKISNLKKKELVSAIYLALTDHEKLRYILNRFIDKEFILLKDLIKNKGLIELNDSINPEMCYFLYKLGLINVFKIDDEYIISMSNEIYYAIKKIDLESMSEEIEINTRIYNITRAMVEVYGVVNFCDVVDYYKKYYDGKKVGIDNTFILLKPLLDCERMDAIMNFEIDKYNIWFTSSMVMLNSNNDFVFDVMDRQKEIKRKVMPLEELLKYTDYSYYEETQSIKELKKYLKKKDVSDDNIETVTKTLVKMYRMGSKFIAPSIGLIQDLDIKAKDMQDVIEYLTNVYNNTRLWENNGWTPIEMIEQNI